jgi:nucleoside-diphosphate-sugar epimerase
MKVFVAGASGAIGRPLVRRLVAAGHDVVAATRTPAKVDWLRDAGARPAVVNAMDPEALKTAVFDAQPEAVIDELTDLPQKISPFGMKHFYDRQTPLKATAAPALIEASKAVGARIHIMQSIAFLYAPGGEPIKDEDAAPYLDAPPPWDTAMEPFANAHAALMSAEEFTGIELRYGYFYGPGTHYAADGAIGDMVRKRRFPIMGGGTGVSSFIHVEDAATATVAALESGVGGVFNVVDDDPAPMHEWLPVYAETLGAKPPRHVPVWLGRLTAGPLLVHFATTLSGASNARIKSATDWEPQYPSWRDGFSAELTERR